MSLRGRLFLAQLPVVTALAVVGILAAQTVSSLGRSPQAILHDNYRSVLAAERMNDALAQMQVAMTRPVPAGREASEESIDVGLERGRFEAELKAEEGNVTEPGEGEAARQLREAWNSYRAVLDRSAEDRGAAAFAREIETAFTPVKHGADQVIAINQEAMVRKSAQASREARRAVQVTSLTALTAFLLASLISSTMLTRMLSPLWLLTRTVARVGEGDFDVRAAVQGNDELAQLASSVNLMIQYLRQYRQSATGKLILAQQASQAAIDSLPDSVIVFDTKGDVLLANDAAEELLGKSPAPPSGLDLASVEAAPRSVIERVRDHALSQNEAYTPKGFHEGFRLASPSGPERYFLPRATPVRSDAGAIAGATVILQDITALRLAYELRNDLVATVAHELRTPLTSLRIATHMCLEEAAGPLTERQADLLHTARDASERLQAMVDQLLDLARIQGDLARLALETVSPGALVADAVAAHEALAGEHQVLLTSAVLPGLADVLADRERIGLVFSNLLTNAIRHSSRGASVSVLALHHPGRRLIRFEVSDSGRGVPMEFQAMLFERFRQVPGAPSGAVGLGLSIARDVVEAHGGEIGLDSAEGRGSRFWFTLPTVEPRADGDDDDSE
jgi:two-component system, NtrC family, sensor histidine kinase KinB